MVRLNVWSRSDAAQSGLRMRRFAQWMKCCAVLGGILSLPGGMAAQQTMDPATPVFHLGDEGRSPGTPVRHPSDKDLIVGSAAVSSNLQTAEPDAAQDTADAQGQENQKQTKRILGIIPNFRAISTTAKLPPQTVKEKFLDATEDSFDYSSVFIPVALAWYSLEVQSTPEFGQGGVGYGRYLWHAAVDQTDENYMVEFVLPVMTHEDTRYYTLGHGGFLKRTGYALSRAVVTRSDSGREVFNVSEVVGAGAASGISSLYYPSRERSLGNTGKEWGIDVAIDSAAFMVREFWPDINHRIFHQGESSRKQR